MNITRNELAVLSAIDQSEYGDNLGDRIWSWSVAQQKAVAQLPKTSIPGVVASLSKKGLVVCDGAGRDQSVGMTEAGIAEYVSAVGRGKTNKWIDAADLAERQAARNAAKVAS